ncbi:hypothetical protein MRX96_041146 [Rhipicephalus microplus]
MLHRRGFGCDDFQGLFRRTRLFNGNFQRLFHNTRPGKDGTMEPRSHRILAFGCLRGLLLLWSLGSSGIERLWLFARTEFIELAGAVARHKVRLALTPEPLEPQDIQIW